MIEPVWVPTDTKTTVLLQLLALSLKGEYLVLSVGLDGAEERIHHRQKLKTILDFTRHLQHRHFSAEVIF